MSSRLSLQGFDERVAPDALPPHLTLLRRAWLGGQPLAAASGHAAFPLPARLESRLPELDAWLAGLAAVASEHGSRDGSRRLVVALRDGQTVETVLLQRDTVCVSTQVGCRVGCVFCKTGEGGLQRDLSCDEILAQVGLARRRQKVIRVVFMGMGEPCHNLDAVLAACERLGHEAEGMIAHKNLVLSTVGSRACFERLGKSPVRPALALSLHTAFADKRRRLLPRAPRLEPAELVELAQRYGRLSGHPVQYQWTLLAGVNDGDDEMDALLALLRGQRAIVNLIPYNQVDALPWARPDWERCVDLVRRLRRGGVLATLRRSGGQDVDAACGQLRARADCR